MATTMERRQQFSVDLYEEAGSPSLENLSDMTAQRAAQRRILRKRRNYRRQQSQRTGRRPVPVDNSWTIAQLRGEATKRGLDLTGSSKWKKADWLKLLD